MDITLSLPDDLSDFIDEQIASGRYASSDDVVRDALHLLARRDRDDAEKLLWLKDAWRAGIDSGDAGDICFETLKREARAKLASQS
jgi:antitoxin ParD1/3/4